VYVCHCRAVTDRVIRAQIEAGACHEQELAERCGAGSGCGGCRPNLRRLLDEHGIGPSVSPAADGCAA
jgi:bacterioferritin-associated ferredoxin